MREDDDTIKARRATQYLADSAAEIAAAKADMEQAHHMLKVTLATVASESERGSVSAREHEALASEKYLAAVCNHRAAVHDYEKLRARRQAAMAAIEFWRSLNANQRAAERGFGSAA